MVMGQPIKYCTEFLDKMNKYYTGCDWKGSDRQCLINIGICANTAYDWEEKYPEFLAVRESGREIMLQKFLQHGYECIGEPNFNAAVYNFLGRAVHNLPGERLLKSRLLKEAKTIREQSKAIVHEAADAKFTTKEARELSSTVSNLANAVKTSELEQDVVELKRIVEAKYK